MPKINSIYSRFLHEESEVPFFTKAEGKAAETRSVQVLVNQILAWPILGF